MRTHEEGNNACDISINYFQSYKLEHIYKEDASFVFVETMMTSANLGAQVWTEHIEIPREYLLSSILAEK
jgi:hypothetical protein